VDICSKSLNKYGYQAAPIHGDLDQTKRTETLENFREGDLRILVASDVAARGLDIPSVSHVFNFDVPIHAEDYVHRIGRTGRAGREGTAIMICNTRDRKNFSNVEALLQKEIPRSNLYDDTSSVHKIENETEHLKTKKISSGEGSNQNKKNKSKNTKNYQKNEESNSTLGLGEHTPDFLSQSFNDRLVS
jgi:ATP-dependent RNA helicase RhlE